MVELGYKLEYVLSSPSDFDALVIVGENLNVDNYPEFVKPYLENIKTNNEVDSSTLTNVSTSCIPNQTPNFAVWSPTGPVNRDYDDVRRYYEAADAGIKRALKAGKKKLVLTVYSSLKQTKSKKYKDALLVSVLGACEALYVPVEVREAIPEKASKAEKLGVASNEIKLDVEGKLLIKNVSGLEHGRLVTRDIGGSDPERMSAEKTEAYCKQIFSKSTIKVDVTRGQENFVKDYPLFAAVNRCASHVDRHDGRIIQLEYAGEDVKNTYLFVGKGVTYDTGGADIKAGGVMAGMHRDKCGAATVAGIFAMLDKLQPKGIKVVGRMAMVRNSVGSDAYVADEIITSAAGVRVRIGNTDAEGRMAMTDPLCHAKLQALDEVNPHLITIATLTGHSIVAVGDKYTCVLDNGPAEETEFARSIQQIGAGLSNPFEVSTLRREDYNFVAGRNEYEDVIQCNNAPSSRTPRGHQFPAAFMIKASGLDKHGIDSSRPLKYSHMDIAGSSGAYPGIPTAAPLVALAKFLNAF